MVSYGTAVCPRCGRTVSAREGRYALHSITARTSVHCRMSRQLVPAEGGSPEAFETRAAIVADLAWQVQDGDPLLCWDYLTALSGNELQRLMMVALAGVPTDRKVNEIYDWVYQLPVAKAGA